MILPKELAKICKEVESMRLFEDIKEKEPQTKMILELQKVPCIHSYMDTICKLTGDSVPRDVS